MTTNGPTVKVIFPAIPTILVAFRDPFRCDPFRCFTSSVRHSASTRPSQWFPGSWAYPSLKNMLVSWDDFRFPNIWKLYKIHLPKHKPVSVRRHHNQPPGWLGIVWAKLDTNQPSSADVFDVWLWRIQRKSWQLLVISGVDYFPFTKKWRIIYPLLI